MPLEGGLILVGVGGFVLPGDRGWRGRRLRADPWEGINVSRQRSFSSPWPNVDTDFVFCLFFAAAHLGACFFNNVVFLFSLFDKLLLTVALESPPIKLKPHAHNAR